MQAKRRHQKRIPNAYLTNGTTTTLRITRLNGEIIDCLIDTEDVAKVQRLGNWHYLTGRSCANYICTGTNRKRIFLGRYLAETPEGEQCLYIDGNTMNCRKANLYNTKDGQRVAKAEHPYIHQYDVGRWDSSVYDPATGYKHYVGMYPTLDEALAAQKEYLAKNPHFRVPEQLKRIKTAKAAKETPGKRNQHKGVL